MCDAPSGVSVGDLVTGSPVFAGGVIGLLRACAPALARQVSPLAVVAALWGLWGFCRAVWEDRKAVDGSGGLSIRVVASVGLGATPLLRLSSSGRRSVWPVVCVSTLRVLRVVCDAVAGVSLTARGGVI